MRGVVKIMMVAATVIVFSGCVHRATQSNLIPKKAPEWVKTSRTFWVSKKGDTLYFKGMALRVTASNVNAVIDFAEADAKRAIVQTVLTEVSSKMKAKSTLSGLRVKRVIKEFVDKTPFPFYRIAVYTTSEEAGYTPVYSAWVLMGITKSEYMLYKQKALSYAEEKLTR